MRVEPPTSTTSSICSTVTPASAMQARQGPSVRSTISAMSFSNSSRVISRWYRLPLYSKLNGGERDERKLLLGFDHGAPQRLHGLAVARQRSSPHSGLNVFEADADEPVVDIVAAEVRVAVGGEHFEDAVVQLQDGDVEGAAAQVVDGDDAFLALVEAVGQRGGGGLVDQAQDFEAGDAAGVLGGLPLGVVEVGRDRDHGLRDRLAQMRFGVLLELAQHEGGNLRRREGLLAELNPDDRFAVRRDAEGEQLQLVLHVGDAAAHQALHRIDGAVGLVDEQRARPVSRPRSRPTAGQRHDARNQAVAILAGDDLGRGQVHVGDQAVGGAEVDADDPLGGRLSEIDLHRCHASAFST